MIKSARRKTQHGVWLWCVWILVALLPNMAAAALSETRVALVIGNSAYNHTPALKNPRNDAKAMAAKLGGLGFQVVSGFDLNHRASLDMLRDFGSAARDADVAVLYYAGHAVQVNGQNYLIPVDARLKTERDLKFEGLALSWFMEELSRARRLRVAILDACRDNPLGQVMARSMGMRSASVGRGLAREDAPTGDTLIAYATRANAVADDGSGDHSPYTAALLANIGTPGLDVRIMLGRVRDAVRTATDGRQEPFVYGSVGGQVWSFSPSAPLTSVTGTNPPEELVPGSQAGAIDYWHLIKDSGNASAYRAFLQRFDDPVLKVLAEAKLKALEAEEQRAAVLVPQTPPAPAETARPTPVVPSSDERRAAEALARVNEIPAQIVQYALHDLGYYKGRMDGLIGPGSRRAIRAFQQAHGFDSTGSLTHIETVALIEAAAEAGHPHSQNALGMMVGSGIGVAKDDVAARRWFEKAAAKGNAYAAYNLGLLYRDGRGVSKSVGKARTYFEQARTGGYAQAAAALKSLGKQQ